MGGKVQGHGKGSGEAGLRSQTVRFKFLLGGLGLAAWGSQIRTPPLVLGDLGGFLDQRQLLRGRFDAAIARRPSCRAGVADGCSANLVWGVRALASSAPELAGAHHWLPLHTAVCARGLQLCALELHVHLRRGLVERGKGMPATGTSADVRSQRQGCRPPGPRLARVCKTSVGTHVQGTRTSKDRLAGHRAAYTWLDTARASQRACQSAS
mmetsp:Transcript_90152/g.254249  ORF Transcript_90152/g.254249 Transcript_90152/m.254249 type:complete len:210 (+) Transcript_90152:747-1376(+)